MLEEILKEIIEKTGISKEELLNRIREKQRELKIISFEGAAYLVARDLGLELPEYKPRQLEMKNIVSGMRNVNVKGKIFMISPIVEFERNGKKGRVVNIFISDGTDYVKVPLWNDQVSIVEDGKLQVGDTVQIISGIARENQFGEKEIVLRSLSRLSLAEEELDISVEELKGKFLFTKPRRVEIKSIKGQGNFEVVAKIVHLFRGNYVFAVCPFCGLSLKEVEGKTVCDEHGEVSADYQLVIPCIIDDGTGNMRAVFFREIAEKLCQLKPNELSAIEVERRYDMLAQRLLGRELLLSGRVKKNKIFGTLEMVVRDFEEIDYSKEISKLLEELESFH